MRTRVAACQVLSPPIRRRRSGRGGGPLRHSPAESPALPRRSWGAMDLLREALVRNRRILQLRDLCSSLLRTLCVLLFALALARPFSAVTSAGNDPNQPVHAILLVDNSLSMGYQRLNGTLLDEAKVRLNEFVDVPLGSHISVLPLCGSPGSYSTEAYASPNEALGARGCIQVVDCATSPAATIDLAKGICDKYKSLGYKLQVALFTDQQVAGWPAESLAEKSAACRAGCRSSRSVRRTWKTPGSPTSSFATAWPICKRRPFSVSVSGTKAAAHGAMCRSLLDRRRRGNWRSNNRFAARPAAKSASRRTVSTCRSPASRRSSPPRFRSRPIGLRPTTGVFWRCPCWRRCRWCSSTNGAGRRPGPVWRDVSPAAAAPVTSRSAATPR